MSNSGLNDSGDRSVFGYGAMRDRGEEKGRYDLLPPDAIRRLALHFQRGAKKYADRNWEKGMELHYFLDSGLRHAFDYMAGKTDEDHLAAAAWNMICAMSTEMRFPELVDIPTRPEYKERHEIKKESSQQMTIEDFWESK